MKQEMETKIFTCSMHPEVQRMEPGTCPKCGMKLVEKNQQSQHTAELLQHTTHAQERNIPQNEFMNIKTEAILTCPFCNTKQQVEMPTNACQHFYECTSCGKLLKPKKRDCCVFCSYADTQCPPKQGGS